MNFWRPFTQEKLTQTPPIAKRASGAYIFDENGKKYLDLVSSWWVVNHGHCNKKIASAIANQVKKLDHVIASEFLNENCLKLIEKLNKITNNEFYKFFFSDNGSTATEVAMKIAWQYFVNKGEEKTKFCVMKGSYHGDTLLAMSAGYSSGFFDKFSDLMITDKIITIDFVNSFEGEKAELLAIEKFEKDIEENKGKIAFLILEPIVQGANGMNMCRPVFLEKICKIAKKNGIIVIFDEVMTGFGKTGKMFAYNHVDFTPDLVCVSKSITGGFLPLGVTFAKKFIYDAFYSDNKLDAFLHGHSYTANPISCAAAVANLDLYTEETFKKINEITKIYQKEVLKLKNIKNIRIIGTICAFDVKNPVEVKKLAMESGFLIRPLGKTVYIMPPFCIKKNELKKFFSFLKNVL